MRPRFYLPSIDEGGRGELDDDEAGHLTRVLRLGVGDEIDVFDGRGRMFRAQVAEAGRRRVVVQVLDSAAAAPEAALQLTLVMSVLKGDKMDAVIRDAAMMGVAVIQPVVATRSEIRLATLVRGERHVRWLRVAIASVKQCGRAVIPQIRPATDVPGWLASRGSAPLVLLVEPSAGESTTSLGQTEPVDRVDLAVGPEGGWTPEELDAFRGAGARLVSLGSRTLRAETAPLVAVAALYTSWNGW